MSAREASYSVQMASEGDCKGTPESVRTGPPTSAEERQGASRVVLDCSTCDRTRMIPILYNNDY